MVMETINVVVNDFEYTSKQTDDDDDLAPKVTMIPNTTLVDRPKVDIGTNSLNETSKSTPKKVIATETELILSLHVRKNHPSSSIIGNPSAGITTRKKDKVNYTKMITDLCYTSAIEPASVDAALKDEYWINVMQEELLQFKHNNV
ncbi:putative mitochondrial protein [Cucumis melo var. makuwa]|uniref:Putative mitochondrial protein n=1 Tax=Cucumis melo var. makuwa TaxID=1194695 RepID=A0A5D3CC52_CUCMM|nr:putative mitochondrial protein [Cucumis melo var. makuwa]